MKTLLPYCLCIVLTLACNNRSEDETTEGIDPLFKAETKEVKLLKDAPSEISECYFENNDLKLIYEHENDSIKWEKKNVKDEFVEYSKEKHIKVAQASVYKLNIYKNSTKTIRKINVYTCPSSIDAIPDSFTPNGDGNFDTWAPIGNGIKTLKFTIYSLNKETLFESDSSDNPWDGTYKGNPVPTGSYKYLVKATLKNGKTVESKGILSLVR